MPGPSPPDPPNRVSGPEPALVETQVLALHAEQVRVSKRVRRTLVRASRSTSHRDTLVEEELVHNRVVVERVPVNRVVEAVPPVREEDGVTIVPVVEEEVVVVRRLVLKEEVRLRQVRTTERHVETVSVREQHATITRTPLDHQPQAGEPGPAQTQTKEDVTP